MKTQVMQFKWTESRGRDSYGWNICSMFLDGKKVSSTCGGGYDMQGAAFGEYLQKHYQDKLREGNGAGISGFSRGKTGKVYLDGAAGFNSMVRIAETIGLAVEYKNTDLYILTVK